MAVYQKVSPTWNYINKIKHMRGASYILSKNNNFNFSPPYSTYLSANSLDNYKKWGWPLLHNVLGRSLATAPGYKFVKTECRGEGNKVGIVIIDRPEVLNALNHDVVTEIIDAIVNFDRDPIIGAIILTGDEKAFVAGADIRELASGASFSKVFSTSFADEWKPLKTISKPIIAAVNGYALGGGCEVALMCDIIIAGEKAKFGQLEINVGTIPGEGGTQRLTHAVGKSRAMQICLTGEMITAQQAVSWGLINSVHPPEKLIDAAVEIGDKISKNSKILSKMVKESINNAFEMTLQEGLETEYRICYSTYATDDRKEGMQAFLEKRKPNFTDK